MREFGAVGDMSRREVLSLIVNPRVVVNGRVSRRKDAQALAVGRRVSVEEERGTALSGEV